MIARASRARNEASSTGDPGGQQRGSAGDAVPFTQTLVVAVAAYSLILPVHGVHRRLVDQKQRRLARLADAIRETELG